MPKNQVRDIFTARIKQLMSQYEGSKTIPHASTIGAMREDYLKSFLRDLFPPKYYPMSGFIADIHGTITPQLDMIFMDRSELPMVSLVDDTVIVPFEIALLIAEVKSTITLETLDQIKRQREAINKMQADLLMASASTNSIQKRERRNNIGTFIMAFESDVSETMLQSWVESEMGNPAGICILGRSNGVLSIFHQIIATPHEIVVNKSSAIDDYEPLFSFIGAVYRWLYLLLLHNSTMSDNERARFYDTHAMWIWEAYLSDYHYQHLLGFRSPK